MDALTSEPPLGNKIEDMYRMMGQGDQREDFEMKESELAQLKVALKNETFRQMLSNYVEEVRDPENQVTYQSEIRQLEKERGNVVHFVNPAGSYVLKTSVDGDKKGFINICSNALIRKPSLEDGVQDNKLGSFWSIPYTQSQGREDFDKQGQKCMVYDVIFNPEALKLAKQNPVLQQTLEQTAIEAVENSFNVSLDKLNLRRPKLKYKGMRHAATIKYKIGDEPPYVLDPAQLSQEQPPEKDGPIPPYGNNEHLESNKANPKCKNTSLNEESGSSDPAVSTAELDYSKWTVPKYAIKYRSHVDMQNFCTDFQRQKSDAMVPDQIVLTANLPLLNNSSSLDADVVDDGEGFELKSDHEALYYLKIKLPHKVFADSAKASFDKDKRQLMVCLNVVKNKSFNPIESSDQDLPTGGTMNVSCEIENGLKDLHLESSNEANIPLQLQPLYEDPFEESGEVTPELGTSLKRTVRFSDEVQRQIYRSNSSILGQRKKNQRKTKSRRKRLNSAESASSVDEDEDCSGMKTRERSFSGESVSSLDEDEFSKYSASY